MSEEKKKLTQDSYDELKEELEHLQNEKRKEVAEKLKKAKEYGDLSENAAYESAKEEQTNVESRIAELKKIIKNAEIIEKDKNADWVQIGSQVKVEIDGKKEKELEIVDGTQSDPFEGKISFESPIGKALLEKPVGATCKVETPSGQKTYKILDIS